MIVALGCLGWLVAALGFASVIGRAIRLAERRRHRPME